MQMFGVEQVVYADADAVDLVRVGRTDAAAGGAESYACQRKRSVTLSSAMVRDHVRGFTSKFRTVPRR